jgi:peptidoglycan/LPS O-acetylase OafA/YrhL
MQNWGFTSELTWNHPAWSISTEFAAYLMFPLLALAVPWQKFSPVVLFAVLLGLLAALALTFGAMGEMYLGGNIAKTGLIRCLFEFAAGMALARLWQSSPAIGVPAWGWLLGAMAIACAGLFFALPETMIAPAAFAAILMACALDKGPVTRALASPLMLWIGETSYATYLMHFLAFILFKIAFVGADLQVGWIGLIGFCVGVQALAAILYSGFEKPAQRWLGSLLPQKAKPA